ncbi:MAG: hypothetical protein HC814_04965 [Rhodobacteraceae bacterium]|nr:hypothetical protein [Paracoccaceae bacterium]
MKISRIVKASAFLVCLAGSASASSITSLYSSFWVLGDSLSGTINNPVTGDVVQRFSNDLLWSERIAGEFEAVGKTNEIYAVPGATAGLARDIDLGAQTSRLLSRKDDFGTDPLVAIWIGGNDIAAFAEGLLQSTSISAYTATLDALIGVGVTDFLLFEVPDVGYTPFVRVFRRRLIPRWLVPHPQGSTRPSSISSWRGCPGSRCWTRRPCRPTAQPGERALRAAGAVEHRPARHWRRCGCI